MKYFKNILETIGNTPLIKLNSLTKDIDALVLAKVEYFNPGSSIKDRMALKMIEDAEKTVGLNQDTLLLKELLETQAWD